MPKTIKIMAGEAVFKEKLNDSTTARKVANALPIEGRAQRWGEEIYFAIPVQADLEPDAREEVEVGEIGYWPTGNAFYPRSIRGRFRGSVGGRKWRNGYD